MNGKKEEFKKVKSDVSDDKDVWYYYGERKHEKKVMHISAKKFKDMC